MSEQIQEKFCRICNVRLNNGNLCDECKDDLEYNIGKYEDRYDVLDDLNYDVLISVLQTNNLTHITVDKMQEIFLQVCKYITDDVLKECKEHYLECGYTNEEFIEFLINPFISNLSNEIGVNEK